MIRTLRWNARSSPAVIHISGKRHESSVAASSFVANPLFDLTSCSLQSVYESSGLSWAAFVPLLAAGVRTALFYNTVRIHQRKAKLHQSQFLAGLFDEKDNESADPRMTLAHAERLAARKRFRRSSVLGSGFRESVGRNFRHMFFNPNMPLQLAAFFTVSISVNRICGRYRGLEAIDSLRGQTWLWIPDITHCDPTGSLSAVYLCIAMANIRANTTQATVVHSKLHRQKPNYVFSAIFLALESFITWYSLRLPSAMVMYIVYNRVLQLAQTIYFRTDAASHLTGIPRTEYNLPRGQIVKSLFKGYYFPSKEALESSLRTKHISESTVRILLNKLSKK